MTDMIAFPSEKLAKIRKAIDRALASGDAPIAAFDADGTLWDIDIGEHFFQYQIDKKLLPNLPADPWGFYREWYARETPGALLWLAKILNGVPLATVREWAKAAFLTLQPPPIFPVMKELIRYLQEREVTVYCVTASVKWAVEPAAAALGITQDHVLGVHTQVVNGIISDRQEGPITWREGKVLGLLEATNKRVPFFASGNTMGDLALLDCASAVRLANCAAPKGHFNYETEQKLLDLARKRCWFFHEYRP